MNREIIYVGIVEDHALYRKPFCSALNHLNNIRVCIDSNNGKEFIDELEHLKIKPDICLMDIRMPVMDGYKTTKYLSERYPDIKVVGLSMFDHEHVIVRMLNCGAKGFLLKETSMTEVEKCIHTVYEQDFYYNALIDGSQFLNKKIHDLNDIEIQYLIMTTMDLTNKQIADEMGVTNRKVEYLRDTLGSRLGVSTRAGFARYAISNGFTKI